MTVVKKQLAPITFLYDADQLKASRKGNGIRSPALATLIYVDSEDALGLSRYAYAPQVAAISQAGNLYVYCGNNPLMFIDPTGCEWYHWLIGGAIVAAAAVAVVVTAGGALPAVYAVGAVASGIATAFTSSTIAAGAFIGASLVFGIEAYSAVLDSQTINEFNKKGSWGTVLYSLGAAGVGGLLGYVAYIGTQENNIFNDKVFTNQTKTGVSNFSSPTKGYDAALKDFNSLNPYDVKTMPNGTLVGKLTEDIIINIHPGTSVNKAPTLEIYNRVAEESIKIRY